MSKWNPDEHLPEYVFCRVCGLVHQKVEPSKCHGEYGTVPEPRWHKAADVEAALRACEQRTLDAAREAVAAWFVENRDEMTWPEALAAIEALRQESSGNPDNPTSAGKPDKPGERRKFTLDEYEDVKLRAYFAGLNAAREAVAVHLHDPLGVAYGQPDSIIVSRSATLAAIDALRDPAIPTPDDGNAGTEQIADPALHKSPRQDR